MSAHRARHLRAQVSAGLLALGAGLVLVPALAGAPAAVAAGAGGAAGTGGAACTGQLAGLTVYSGNSQIAKVGEPLADPLQVQALDTGGCPVANVEVEFVVPGTGAGATFSGGLSAVSVATATNGLATAPALTADGEAGSYSVVASGQGFTATFTLTNSTAGVASTVVVQGGSGQSATVGTSFSQPLSVSVADSFGDPISGAGVVFQIVADNGATANFAGGGTSASVQSTYSGTATTPQLIAGTASGTFTVTAIVGGATSATFTLTDVAGPPDALAAGVGTSQAAVAGTAFAVPLAVTVTDADGNPVAGAEVTFSAPGYGATGVFAPGGHSVVVTTDTKGTATAPVFVAGTRAGGYVVTASVAGVSPPATFALVDTPRTGAAAGGPPGPYRLVTRGGRVMASGSTSVYQARTGLSGVVGMAATPGDAGYWLVTAKGRVSAYGEARYYGSAAGLHLATPIVGIASTPDGKGYWLAASGGGVFAYGDARYYGSTAGLHLATPIVGIASTPDGKGYWLAASGGGVFAYGDARYHGRMTDPGRAGKVVGVVVTTDGQGYWLATSKGAVFAYGDAVFYGSAAGLSPGPVTAIVRTADGDGYWLVSANGTCAGFGDAGGQGTPTVGTASPVVAGAA